VADCHAECLGFEYEITPSLAELERSLSIRRSLRRAIASCCLQRRAPIRFHPQGSFRLLTAVRRDGLDLDDGVLFCAQSFASHPSIEALHEIVFDGLCSAGVPVFVRQPCLRVLHARGVRIDIVIYLAGDDGRVHLAHRKDGWVPAHSSHLIAWFEDLSDGPRAVQLRRLIKYYKMWAVRMAPDATPSGVALTILAKGLHRYDPRDDVALTRTMRAVLDHLEAGHGCLRPTPPIGEELLKDELSSRQHTRFLALLRGFVETAEHAVATVYPAEAIRSWRSLFGPSFGVLDREITAQDRARQLRRVLEDFDGFSQRTIDAESVAQKDVHQWTL
jgi:hypothetical protein